MKLFSTREAAEYLDMPMNNLKYHIKVGNLKGQLVARSMVFTQEALDEFKASKRPQGRPRKSRKDDNE